MLLINVLGELTTQLLSKYGRRKTRTTIILEYLVRFSAGIVRSGRAFSQIISFNGLLNHVFSSGITALDDWMTNELERIWKEAIMA
jgi:hypothetical protein